MEKEKGLGTSKQIEKPKNNHVKRLPDLEHMVRNTSNQKPGVRSGK